MLYIGVDLGTSAVKLLVMDETGDIKKIVSKEYPLFFPHPGWSEQKPEDWFEKSMEGIKELTAECDKSQVAGISFGGRCMVWLLWIKMIMLFVRQFSGMTEEQGKRQV